MYHRVFGIVTILLFQLSCFDSIGIDDKLDFGHTRSHPSLRRYDSGRRNSYELPTGNVVTKVETNDNFDKLGIVCVEGGCNTTESFNDLGNIVKTDVLVHVKTKVDLNHSRTEPIGETPDVPVVVGYSGSKLDRTYDDEPGLNPQPAFIPSSKPQPAGGAAFNRQVGIPIYDQSFQPGYYRNEAAFNTQPSKTMYGQVYSPINQSYYPVSGPFISPSSTFQNRRIDSGSYIHPLQDDGMLSAKPQVDISIKTSSPVAIGVADNAQRNIVNTQYMTNGIELTVPYFEPSHHSHHFGEHMPPQFIHFDKKPSSFNPVEFKTTKSSWTPSTWYNQVSPQIHTITQLGEDVKCVCHNRKVSPGLGWYPNMNRRVSSGIPGMGVMYTQGDPGSQINDKLAPLN